MDNLDKVSENFYNQLDSIDINPIYGDGTVESILGFLDAGHGIVLSERVGLLGRGKGTEPAKSAVTNYEIVKNDYEAHEIAYINAGKSIPVRGEYFDVINSDGVLHVPYPVTKTFMILSDIVYKPSGYIFIIYNKELENIFGDKIPALIADIDGKFFTNSAEISTEYPHIKYDVSITLTSIMNYSYKICVNGRSFISKIINVANNIFWLKEVKIGL